MMKRLIVLLLAALLLICPSCKRRGAPKPAETDTTPDTTASEDDLFRKVLSDWFDYLYASDCMYRGMLWVLSYADRYTEEPTWDNLQIARTALYAAERTIAQRGLDEPLMTTEDYVRLLKDGHDASFVEVQTKAFEQDRQSFLSDCGLLKSALYHDVLWKAFREDFRAETNSLKEKYVADMEYLNISTEYLLLDLNEPKQEEAFRATVAEYCPTLSAHAVGTFTDQDAAYAAASETLDRIERIVEASNESLGKSRAALYQLEDQISQGGADALLDNMADIANIPVCLPLPEWDYAAGADYSYFYKTEDGSVRVPEEPEQLARIPDSYTIRFYNVGKELLLEYQAHLADLGAEPVSVDEEEERYSLSYFIGDEGVSLVWTPENVTIFVADGRVAFAPEMYVMYLYGDS